MQFRLAIPLGFASLALAVTNPSAQKVTNSAAFSSGAGNNNNANIYDGTGNGGQDTYSKFCPSIYLLIHWNLVRKNANCS